MDVNLKVLISNLGLLVFMWVATLSLRAGKVTLPGWYYGCFAAFSALSGVVIPVKFLLVVWSL